MKILLFLIYLQLLTNLMFCSTTVLKESESDPLILNDLINYVNLDHLDHLSEVIYIDNIPMRITYIYSEYPDYKWTLASGEGISCVDDVSRAAIVYLCHYELTNDSTSLKKAELALNFVLYMGKEDGQFYNFIKKDYSINKEGRTSKKSFDFWAVRGLRALCYGYRVFIDIDTTIARKLKKQIEPTVKQINSYLEHYGEYEVVEGVKIPRWLVLGGDATAEVILALIDYYSVHPEEKIENMIRKLSDGLVEFQNIDKSCPFYGMHYSWKNIWHAWGNSQLEALAKAARILKNSFYIESSKKEADNFYLFLLARNFLNSIEIKEKEEPIINTFSQISYGIRPIVSGLMELYITTKDEKYAKMAGLVASWLLGNNRAKEVMYDIKTGRGYDGIDNEKKINRNSGAESTIESLMTIMEIIKNSKSLKYFHYDLIETNEEKNYSVYRDSNGNEVWVGWDRRLKRWNMKEE
jgi:hypothetical protein